MADRSRKHPKRPRDMNQRAASALALETGEAAVQVPETPKPPEPTPDERHAAAVALGWLGGTKGGKAEPESLPRNNEVRAQGRRPRLGGRSHTKFSQTLALGFVASRPVLGMSSPKNLGTWASMLSGSKVDGPASYSDCFLHVV